MERDFAEIVAILHLGAEHCPKHAPPVGYKVAKESECLVTRILSPPREGVGRDLKNLGLQNHIDDALFLPHADYLLRVRGHSMKGAGILDGDLVAVHHTHEVSSGQIVVARLENDVTVKRFRRRGNKVRLMPENSSFSPMEIDLAKDPLVIKGLVVGVIRNKKI